MVNLLIKLLQISYFCGREKFINHIRSHLVGLRRSRNLPATTAYNAISVALGVVFCAQLAQAL